MCRLQQNSRLTQTQLQTGATSSPVTAYRYDWLHPAPSRYNSVVAIVGQSIRVKVLFFGRLKDAVGRAEESLEVPEASTIEQLFALHVSRLPELGKYRSSLVASHNQEFAAWDTPLHSGDEIAFLPPVSGG